MLNHKMVLFTVLWKQWWISLFTVEFDTLRTKIQIWQDTCWHVARVLTTRQVGGYLLALKRHIKDARNYLFWLAITYYHNGDQSCTIVKASAYLEFLKNKKNNWFNNEWNYFTEYNPLCIYVNLNIHILYLNSTMMYMYSSVCNPLIINFY